MKPTNLKQLSQYRKYVKALQTENEKLLYDNGFTAKEIKKDLKYFSKNCFKCMNFLIQDFGVKEYEILDYHRQRLEKVNLSKEIKDTKKRLLGVKLMTDIVTKFRVTPIIMYYYGQYLTILRIHIVGENYKGIDTAYDLALIESKQNYITFHRKHFTTSKGRKITRKQITKK